MKKRILFFLISCLVAIAFLAGPATAATSSCNCWDGDMICTIMDDEGNVTGWIFVQGGC